MNANLYNDTSPIAACALCACGQPRWRSFALVHSNRQRSAVSDSVDLSVNDGARHRKTGGHRGFSKE